MSNTAPVTFLAAQLRHAETLSRVAVWVAGGLTVASVLLISFDILARKLIGFTVARTSLARSLGEPAAAATDDIDSAIGAVERFSRMAIRGMRAGPCD